MKIILFYTFFTILIIYFSKHTISYMLNNSVHHGIFLKIFFLILLVQQIYSALTNKPIIYLWDPDNQLKFSINILYKAFTIGYRRHTRN